jgi:hypothetical protein
MSAPFVTELRTDDDVLVIGGGDGEVLHLRVQAAELWEALRVDAPGSASVASVKKAALDRFYPIAAAAPDFVVKVRGFEVLDENVSLDESGIRDGSTLLLANRRRRPVR